MAYLPAMFDLHTTRRYRELAQSLLVCAKEAADDDRRSHYLNEATRMLSFAQYLEDRFEPTAGPGVD